jgi:phosphoribosyl-AMP cyclohydrolase / phosphoribosyl-ATP pyrophosphohydrolase
VKREFEPGEVRFGEDGLVPVVIQDADTREVLTLAYMNKEALDLTLKTGEMWLYSRSRRRLWHKGETSGHTQRVVSLHLDCDRDALTAHVVPAGPACHRGTYSCFDGIEKESRFSSRFDVLERLEKTIAARAVERPEGSYTARLLEQGLDRILKKVGEEAAEVIIAAKNGVHAELRHETADLLFHLLVLLRAANLPLDEVLAELKRREGEAREDVSK